MNQAINQAINHNMNQDHRQRFFIQDSPVRGDAVRLSRSYATIIAQKDYPEAIKRLLGEMLVSASLLIGTLKIEGRLSIQLQSSDDNSSDSFDNKALLKWAMAECDHEGNLRALADWKHDTPEQQQAWTQMTTANEAFAQLDGGINGVDELNKGVMFINIQPLENGHKSGQAYQGIVERSHDNLADCLAHYQKQSAQIPTIIKLACDGLQAGGLLVQLLPLSQEEQLAQEQAENAGDDDLWTRLSVLTNTIKAEELTKLDSNEILFRLYNEEEVVTPESVGLKFACTCSAEKCQSAIIQLGEEQALAFAHEHGGHIEMDCGFCGSLYRFDEEDIAKIFAS